MPIGDIENALETKADVPTGSTSPADVITSMAKRGALTDHMKGAIRDVLQYLKSHRISEPGSAQFDGSCLRFVWARGDGEVAYRFAPYGQKCSVSMSLEKADTTSACDLLSSLLSMSER